VQGMLAVPSAKFLRRLGILVPAQMNKIEAMMKKMARLDALTNGRLPPHLPCPSPAASGISKRLVYLGLDSGWTFGLGWAIPRQVSTCARSASLRQVA